MFWLDYLSQAPSLQSKRANWIEFSPSYWRGFRISHASYIVFRQIRIIYVLVSLSFPCLHLKVAVAHDVLTVNGHAAQWPTLFILRDKFFNKLYHS